MRILQISSAKNIGGGERHLIDLMSGLAERGHQIFLAAPENSPLRDAVNACPQITFLPTPPGIFSFMRLARIISGNRLDIVHAHAARDYLSAALAVRFAAPVKLVLTRHVLFPMKSLHRFALANVARVIAVSRAVERQLQEQKIFPPGNIRLIYNGIDTERFSADDNPGDFRALYDIPENAYLIGTVGELKKLKGQEDLILAAEYIANGPESVYFIIVGRDNSADGAYGRYLRSMAEAAGASDRFIWIDWLDDTAPLLRALDVFVSPSHSESFGLAILEALAADRAVAATKTEGAKELLDGARLVEIGRPDLLGGLLDLLRSADIRKEFRDAQKTRGIENFTLKKMLDETEKLYLELERTA
jgi:glycosyltransferase involved in cell wall biosynthesis